MQEYYNKEEQFLSTPSARRATASSGRPAKTTAYFYPRPPRGGRRWKFVRCVVSEPISIHALREEGDRFAGPKRRPAR